MQITLLITGTFIYSDTPLKYENFYDVEVH